MSDKKEYIERDEAVRKALEACVKVVGHGISHIDAVDIAEAIDDIPAADVVEVRHGYWIEQLDGTHYCSECGHDATYTFDGTEICGIGCPFCYAKMDGGNKDG